MMASLFVFLVALALFGLVVPQDMHITATFAFYAHSIFRMPTLPLGFTWLFLSLFYAF